MTRIALLSLVVGLVALGQANDPSSADLKKLSGTWVLVSGEDNGKKLAEEALKGSQLVFEGDAHTVKVGKANFKGTHKLDATKTPKTIDITDTEGPFKGKTVLGIYALEGDQFKLCYAPPGKDRPTEFAAKAGSGLRYHIWKREAK